MTRILLLPMLLLFFCSLRPFNSEQLSKGESQREWISKNQPKTKKRNKKNPHKHHHLTLMNDAISLT